MTLLFKRYYQMNFIRAILSMVKELNTLHIMKMLLSQ